MSIFHQEFIEFAIRNHALCFGQFKTKAGRLSPYFFNAGLFNNGRALQLIGQYYARAILESAIPFDMLFGPAYKGIPLVSTIAIALAQSGHNHSFSFNRKETKNHGEGGDIIGAPLAGRVLIVDDVISAGISVKQSMDMIHAAGATPCGIVVALDRMEQGEGSRLSAIQEIECNYGIPVISLINLDDITTYLRTQPHFAQHFAAIETYRTHYGVSQNKMYP
ncbi:MAG: orotate phosphoribosyltransferase [Nitrosomonas sp.]|nr:orotate phosphoribosyltransferase [Nitrosomonas sp.]